MFPAPFNQRRKHEFFFLQYAELSERDEGDRWELAPVRRFLSAFRINRITLEIQSENKASLKATEKCGFQKEGIKQGV